MSSDLGVRVDADVSAALAALSDMAEGWAVIREAFRCREVLAPIPGERFECALGVCHPGPHRDALSSVEW